MKKRIPVILTVLCVCVIGIGVYGALNAAHNEDAPGASLSLQTGHASQGFDLLDVSTPESLPSMIKNYEGFRVSFNRQHHTPNWVAWELLGSETDGGESRSNKFWQDSEIDGCPDTRDYSNSGFDRGHLCPAADQKWSAEAMRDCFSLANIAPQSHALNTGAWKTLENKERLWAQRDSALIIIAGPVYNDSDRQTIGASQVRVPGAFFKVIAAPYLDKPRGIAFVYPNMTAPGNMEAYVQTIRDVEKITGFDFLSQLPDDIEDEIETVASFREWNSKAKRKQ